MLRILMIVATCLVGFGWWGDAAAQQQPKRIALVVGSAGDEVWGPLTGAPKDAKMIADKLMGLGFELIEGHEIIIQDKPESKFEFMGYMEEFVHSIGPGTVALFYYAGHGASLYDTDYIVPTGAQRPTSRDEYTRNLVDIPRLVIRKIESAGGYLNIIVLDACRDHPPLAPYDVATRGFSKVGIGLVEGDLEGRHGTVVLTSDGPGEVAKDDSYFATTFAAEISRRGVDLHSAFQAVVHAVRQHTSDLQWPQLKDNTDATFYFSSTLLPAPVSAVMAKPSYARPADAESSVSDSNRLQPSLQDPQSGQACSRFVFNGEQICD